MEIMHKSRYWLLSALVLFVLISAVSAYYNSSRDSIFSVPLQKPKEVERYEYVRVANPVIFSALSYMGMGNTKQYEVKKIIEKEINTTLLYPFEGINVQNNGYEYDIDDNYFIKSYDTRSLMKCARNATSISDIYKCTVEFDKEQMREGRGNCRSSTSAFKIVFMNSPLGKNETEKLDFSLMKAYVKGSNYNAHRFIILSNKNGNFVIDPYFGILEDMNSSVTKYSESFYNNKTAVNYRGIVYKVDYFYGS